MLTYRKEKIHTDGKQTCLHASWAEPKGGGTGGPDPPPPPLWKITSAIGFYRNMHLDHPPLENVCFSLIKQLDPLCKVSWELKTRQNFFDIGLDPLT